MNINNVFLLYPRLLMFIQIVLAVSLSTQLNAMKDWENPEVITTFQDKHKGNLERNLLIRESLEIRRQDTVNNGLNERNDISSKFVKTTAWVPILKKLK